MRHIKHNIYLGDIDDGRRDELDCTISLTKEELESTDLHTPLNDGKNDFREFTNKINEIYKLVRECMENDKDVLIHCASGISRSSAVIATIIAMHDGSRYETAMQKVRSERIIANPNPELKHLSKRYLGETDGKKGRR